jgi:hypothetical protein
MCGGTVESGTSMVQGADVKESQDKDDIWVAQVSGDDGSVNWLQQIRTPEKYVMARAGGIVADVDGNAVVLRDTYDSLFRDCTSSEVGDFSDIFVVSLDTANGSYLGGAPAPVVPPTAPIAPTNPPITPTNPPIAAPILPPHQQHSFQPLGVQLDGPLYAGGVVYNSKSGSIILTGTAYHKILDDANEEYERSQCFITVLDLEDASFVHTKYFGYGSDSPASCSAVTYSPADDVVLSKPIPLTIQ